MENQSSFEQLQERKYEAPAILRQIIDRDCHVAASPRAVIRHVIDRLRDGYATFGQMPKTDRRQLIDDCLAIHRANRGEYQAVMLPAYDRKEEE